MRKLLFLLLLIPALMLATNRHVKVSGGASSGAALDSATAWTLAWSTSASNTTLQAGDTVWIHAGTYTGADFDKSGTSANPIIYRNYQNQLVRLSESSSTSVTAYVNGSYIRIWGLEFTNTATTISGEGSNCIEMQGVGSKLINCVVYNAATTGIHSSPGGSIGRVDGPFEIYGCIVYLNGRKTAGENPGSFGYGMYLQHDPGDNWKTASNNLVFNNYGKWQIHMYGGAGAPDSILLDHNFMSNTAWWAAITAGGEDVKSKDVHLDTNYFYGVENPDGLAGTIFQEYGSAMTNPKYRGNYFYGGEMALNNATTGRVYTGNTYYGVFPKICTNWSSQTFTNFDTSSVSGQGNRWFISSAPTGTQVFVLPNKYEPGRANIVIYNWGQASSVSVDLSSVLAVGSPYTIRDVQNYHGTPLMTGTYAGAASALPYPEPGRLTKHRLHIHLLLEIYFIRQTRSVRFS